ncbi:hypothetical protein AMECASPLE_006075 [Ameca splendens]|uniref:Potassium channel subfamily K member n=1 Tax=Ameca splendens TaxID=208324 RepID=A0ABV0YAN5_9TELE
MVTGRRGDWCAHVVERHQSGINFALLVISYILYLVIGAAIFSAIELPYERELRKELKVARLDFLSNNTCVSDAHLEELLARALEASNYGVSVLGNDTNKNWDFVSSLFFTSTVLTTTGYGHSVPLSDGGKAFCILYSLVGIPATLFFLSAIVERLVDLLSRNPIAHFHRRWAMSRPKLAIIHAAFLSIIMALLFLFIPAWIFMAMENDWNFLESLYFCFISLTTIGLGDYVPGETQNKEDNPHPHMYRLAITVYLLVGLVCVLVVLETCYELPQLKLLRRRFYKETVQELDSEATNIISHDQLSDQLPNPGDHMTNQLPVISSVSQQANTLHQNGTSGPYTPASGTTVNEKLS